MCPSTRVPTEQEAHGRHGRPITDHDANEINRVEELSYDLKIRDVMTADLKIATPDMPLSKVLDILRMNRISGLPVVENEKLVGVLSLEDIVRALQRNDLSAPTSQYMTREVVTVANYDSIVKAMSTFTEKGLGRLPVVDENNRVWLGLSPKGILRVAFLSLCRRITRRKRFAVTAQAIFLKTSFLNGRLSSFAIRSKPGILRRVEKPPAISNAP